LIEEKFVVIRLPHILKATSTTVGDNQLLAMLHIPHISTTRNVCLTLRDRFRYPLEGKGFRVEVAGHADRLGFDMHVRNGEAFLVAEHGGFVSFPPLPLLRLHVTFTTVALDSAIVVHAGHDYRAEKGVVTAHHAKRAPSGIGRHVGQLDLYTVLQNVVAVLLELFDRHGVVLIVDLLKEGKYILLGGSLDLDILEHLKLLLETHVVLLEGSDSLPLLVVQHLPQGSLARFAGVFGAHDG